MRGLSNVGTVVVAAVALSDCLGPTEIEVQITTDVSCSNVNSTAVAVGPAGDDSRDIGGKTTSCVDGGAIGSIFVSPSSGMDDVVGIRVTLGVGATQADLCRAPDFSGCIVARRQLHFVPHTSLVLPVQMQQSCFGHVCDPSSTCNDGTCVDAGVPCDQTNTCPLPTPDAGACALAPTLVVPQNAPVTPHLVRTTLGYAIGYIALGGAGTAPTYDVIAVTTSGAISKPIIAVTPPTSDTLQVALGTDGTNYMATYVTATGLAFEGTAPDGTHLGIGTYSGQMQGPLTGFGFDGKSYTTFATNTGTPTWIVWTPGATFLNASPGGVGFSDPAFAFYNGVDYGSAHDATTCILYTGVPSATIGVTQGATHSFTTCTTVRIAENAPGVQLVATEQQGLLRLQSSPTSANVTTLDKVDPQAIYVLPAGGNSFHVVFGAADSITRMNVDVTNIAANQQTSVVQSSGFTTAQGLGVGFDAVADPSATSYAVTYWSATPSPGIYLARFCE